jgi:hypothetical protein
MLDGASLCDDPHRRRRGWIERCSVETAEHVDDGKPGVFQGGAQFVNPIQAPHVAANPGGSNAQLLFELSRSVQQGDGEVEADDCGSTLGEGQRVPPMATPDINETTRLRQLEQIP